MNNSKTSRLYDKYKYFLIVFIVILFISLFIYPLFNENLSIGKFDTSKLSSFDTLIVLLPFIYISCLSFFIINDKDNSVPNVFKYSGSLCIVIFVVFMFIEVFT